MTSLEESVVRALDGGETDLYSYLPYILQDLWEFGSDADFIVGLIRKHLPCPAGKTLLDLGCGKGAVSVKASAALGLKCLGLDAMEEFLSFARSKAKEYGCEPLCRFGREDIRTWTRTAAGKDVKFNIIVPGSIGPVLGDCAETLKILSRLLTEEGIIILDDGYLPDDSSFFHPAAQKKSLVMRQIAEAGMVLTEEGILDREGIRDSDEEIFSRIKQRCEELAQAHPDRKEIFRNYVRQQAEENAALEDELICAVMVLRKEPAEGET